MQLPASISPTSHHRRPGITLGAAILLILTTASVHAQWPFGGGGSSKPSIKQATGISWDLSQAYSDTQVSTNAQSMTTRLPPATNIDSNFQGRFGKVLISYGSGDQLPETRFIQGQAEHPFGTKFTCGPSSANAYYVYCQADVNWLRTLTAPTSVDIEVAAPGFNPKPSVRWTFEPAPPGQVFIDRITGPGAVTLGNLAEFTIRLTAPAPSGGVAVDWMLDPGGCFSQLQGNAPFRAGRLNRLTIPQGQQYRTFALGTSQSCSYTSATLRTWVGQRVDRSPNYKALSFSLRTPRRR